MRICEFCSIKIDDFTQKADEPTPQLCFLTHMHEDHTNGLARKTYYGPHVYCTATTRALLLNFRSKNETGELKYNHLRREVCGKDIVRALELDKPYELPYLNTSVKVTLIDANHCPGAAMILIQPKSREGTAVLYTGDLRCEKWHLNVILRNPALLPFVGVNLSQDKNTNGLILQPEPISLYVDSTFRAHANPFKGYPENRTGIKSLLNLLASYPPEVSFCLADGCSGYEEALILVSNHLKSRVHVSSYQYNLYMLAADTSPLAEALLGLCTTDLLDENGASVRIHFCQRNPACPCRDPMSATAFFKPCNQPKPELVNQQNQQIAEADIPSNVMIPLGDDHRIFKGPNQRYYYDEKTHSFFPLFPWFYFSRHASFSEIQQLCAAFNTCSVRTLEGDPLDLTYHTADPTVKPLPTANNLSLIPHPRVIRQPELSRSKAINDSVSSKRVISLIGGARQENELLPIIRKRKKIPIHYDRQRDRQSRLKKIQASRGNYDTHEEPESSSFDTSDEERGHQAMMFIGYQNTRKLDRLKWHNSFVENERRLKTSLDKPVAIPSLAAIDHSTLEDTAVNHLVRAAVEATEINPSKSLTYQRLEHPTYENKGTTDQQNSQIEQPLRSYSTFDHLGVSTEESSESRNKEEGKENHKLKDLKNIQGSSSLPSPPSAIISNLDLNFVDDTLPEGHTVNELAGRLRENPQIWFDFKFDCLTR